MGIHERRQREKNRRRREIITAARKVFSTKGFNAATMEEIALEAQLSPGALYLYFKSKEDLHTLLSIEILKHLANKIREVDNKNFSVETKIEKFCEVFIEIYDCDSNILINLFHLQSGETLQNLSTEVLQCLNENSILAHGAVTDVMKKGTEQEIFIDEHPAALADILWATYAGVVLWVNSKRLLNNQKDFIKPTLKTAFKIINRGINRR